jgi:regulator of sigma E protease
VRSEPPAGETGEKPGAERQVTLDLRGLTPPAEGVKAALASIGLRDTQLTVGSTSARVDRADPKIPRVLQRGDWMMAWNGEPLRDFYALSEKLMANKAPEAKVTVLRDYKQLELTVPLAPIEVQKPEGPETLYMLPVAFWAQPDEPPMVIERYPGRGALRSGLAETARQTAELGATVARLFTGDIPIKALGGPMLIAKVAGDSAKHGWQTFLSSMALISINLGLLNLFPIPVLDGGQLVLMGAEGVRRRPLREAAIENFQKVGFAMIVALVMLATYNDLSRFWKSMLASVVGMFQ